MSLEATAKELSKTPPNVNPYAGSFRVGRKAKVGPQYEMIDLSIERYFRDGEDLHKMILNELHGIDGIIDVYVRNLPIYLRRSAKQPPTVEVK